MNKLLKSVMSVITLALVLILTSVAAMAGEVESISVTPENGAVSVSGVAGSDVFAVLVMVYDESEENLLKMESVAVNDSKEFMLKIELADGNYIIKAADYEGGAYKSAKVTVSSGQSGQEETTAEATTKEANKDTDETKKNDETTSATETTVSGSSDNSQSSVATGDTFSFEWVMLLVAAATVVTVLISKKRKETI